MQLVFDIGVCLYCGVPLPQPGRQDRKWCSSSCGNKVRRDRHYKENPEYYRQKRYKDNSDVARRIHYRIKSRAKRSKIPFNLDVSDLEPPSHCPVLGLELFTKPGLGTNQHNSPSVDRINPTLGYTKGNVRIISMRANLLKSDATVEELEKVLEDLKHVSHCL